MRIDGKTETARQTMSWLHGWLGLLAGCLLYVIFFTGSLSFYQKQLSLWMQPELHQSVNTGEQQAQFGIALQHLQKTAPLAASWQISLPNSAQATINVSHLTKGEVLARHEKPKQTMLDAQTGAVLQARDTAGAKFISLMHFQLYGVPHVVGRWIVGIATLLMLVALISGIVIHKKIFKEFFVLRRGKGLRSWLDGHNAVAVYSLPFQLLISFSGLLLLMYTLMPWAIDRVYPQGKSQFAVALQAEQRGQSQVIPLTTAQQLAQPITSMPDLSRFILHVQQQWPNNPVASIQIKQPNTAQAQIEFYARHSENLLKLDGVPSIKFNAITGAVISQTQAQREAATSVATSIYNLMLALHRASASDTALRALLFISGLMGVAMIASGQILWVVKKQGMNKANVAPSRGLRWMQCCNVAVMLGLILACVCYLYANRLIPAAVSDRRSFEMISFFAVWLLSLIHAVLRPHRQAWLEQLLLLALLLALLPVLNAMTGGMSIGQSIEQGQWAVVGVDLAALLFASLIGFAYYQLKHYPAHPPRKIKKQPSDNAQAVNVKE